MTTRTFTTRRLQHSPTGARQRGAIAIMVGLCLAMLIGFAGLALDGGHLYVTKTELQNAADACALSASQELTGAPIPADAFVRGTSAGIKVASLNSADFQGSAIAAGEVEVAYGDSLTGGAWVTTNPPGTSKYVRCTITRGGIVPWFMQVLGFGNQTVAAMATATLAPSQNNCIAIPLGMCSAGAAPTYGLVKGQWYGSGFSNKDSLTGSFNWIDFSPPAGGANELKDILLGTGACTIAPGSQVGNPGAIQSIRTAWNTRFGIYAPSMSPSDGVPDMTGYAYRATNWPQQNNALADFLARRTSNSPYGASVNDGNTLTGLDVKPASSNVLQAPALATSGADRRLVIAPIINCAGLSGSQTVPVQDWACVLMLHPMDNDPGLTIYLEYEGLTSDPTVPCASVGGVGNPVSTGPKVPALVQ